MAGAMSISSLSNLQISLLTTTAIEALTERYEKLNEEFLRRARISWAGGK